MQISWRASTHARWRAARLNPITNTLTLVKMHKINQRTTYYSRVRLHQWNNLGGRHTTTHAPSTCHCCTGIHWPHILTAQHVTRAVQHNYVSVIVHDLFSLVLTLTLLCYQWRYTRSWLNPEILRSEARFPFKRNRLRCVRKQKPQETQAIA